MTQEQIGQSKCGKRYDALGLVERRWLLRIVACLIDRPKRFGELREALPRLSAKTLAQRIQEMEATGLVERCTLPPPVSAQVYSLTARGHALERVVFALSDWEQWVLSN